MLRLSSRVVLIIFILSFSVLLLGCPPKEPRYIEERSGGKKDEPKVPLPDISDETKKRAEQDGEEGGGSSGALPGFGGFDRAAAKTPWIEARKGMWAIYNEGSSATYYEVKRVTPTEVLLDVYACGDWQPDQKIDLAIENRKYISSTTELVIQAETQEGVKYEVYEIKPDGRQAQPTLLCTQIVRQTPQVRTRNYFCTLIPFYNGKVYSETIQAGETYINARLVYWGKNPPDREGDKFKEYIEIAKNWTGMDSADAPEDSDEEDTEPYEREEPDGRGWDDDEGSDTDVPDER
ncbi:MAG: hypothetical protein E3J72_19185 [Planctomycetota bacterium]|nr:MAG: hypothetical protein E3J72_19185 [Planctomycetota bacterium]